MIKATRFIIAIILSSFAVLSARETLKPRTMIADPNGGIAKVNAFGVLETAGQFPLFDANFKDSVAMNKWATSVAFNGLVTQVLQEGVVELTATTDGDIAIFQTKEKFKYQAGRAQTVQISMAPGDTLTNSLVEAGYYDGNNGLFFRFHGDNFYVCQMSDTSGVATTECVESANFGAGGLVQQQLEYFSSNRDKETIFEIDFQWLGSGTTRFYLNGPGSQRHELYAFENPMRKTAPYMRHAVLPIRFKVQGSAGETQTTTMRVICASVYSSGGSRPDGKSFALGRGSTGGLYTTTAASSLISVMALRAKTTFDGFDNDIVGLINEISIKARAADAAMVVLKNSTITGGTWTSVSTRSGFEYATSITSCTGGEQIGYESVLTDTGGGNAADTSGSGKSFLNEERLVYSALDGRQESICILIHGLGDTGSVVDTVIHWEELH